MGKSSVIRASKEVTKYLRTKQAKTKEPWDSILRRMFGLPDRKGNPQTLTSFWILKNPETEIFKLKKDAKGEAIVRAIQMKKKRPEKPTKVMEIK